MSNYKSLHCPATFLSPLQPPALLAQDVVQLRQELRYDPETGEFTWLRDQAKKYKAGDKAGNLNRRTGYVQISIRGVLIRAQRLAWVITFGKWPDGVVDHINGIRSDNRMSNLRDVPETLNFQNQRRAHTDNRAGFLGVEARATRSGKIRYRALICVNRKTIRLGTYVSPELAHKAYLSAKRRLHDGCTL